MNLIPEFDAEKVKDRIAERFWPFSIGIGIAFFAASYFSITEIQKRQKQRAAARRQEHSS